MRALSGAGDYRPSLPTIAVSGAVAVLTLSSVARPAAILPIAFLLALTSLFVYAHSWLLAWRQLIGLLILVILFIPIQRYAMGGGLPFQLEPYRILVALMLAGWLASLLIDDRVRLKASGFEAPIALIAVASVASEVANGQRIASLGVQAEVVKGLMFLASFFLIFFLIVSVVRTRVDVERVVEVLCAGGGGLAIFAVIEFRTHYNFFNHLHGLMPFLNPLNPEELAFSRGGDVRVLASAPHPIALGALFVVLLPLAVYLAMRPGKRIWWGVAFLVGIGAISSVSRTSVVMLIAAGLVFLWQRPRQTLGAWPLIVPAVLVIQFAVPGALRSIEASFFPAGGLIAQQSAHADYTSKNRLSRWGPALEEWSADPLVGEGYSTRQPQLQPNIFVTDDQWLKTLVETGILGVLGWMWLFGRSIRRLVRQGREDDENGGWLEVALAASIASFAVGMGFCDAFSFIQVTVILFVLLALGASLAAGKEKNAGRSRGRAAARTTLGDGQHAS